MEIDEFKIIQDIYKTWAKSTYYQYSHHNVTLRAYQAEDGHGPLVKIRIGNEQEVSLPMDNTTGIARLVLALSVMEADAIVNPVPMYGVHPVGGSWNA